MNRRKFRLWPRSLLGQMLLALALGLLVAQSISAALLYQAAEHRREQALVNAAAFRLLGNPGPDRKRAERWGREDGGEHGTRTAERRAWARREAGGLAMGLPIPLRLQTTDTFPLLAGEIRIREREQALREILGNQGIVTGELIVVSRPLSEDPMARGRERRRERMVSTMGPDTQVMLAAAQMPQRGGWTVARVIEPTPQRGALRTIIGQTLLIFLLLFALQFLLLRRITRPLQLLTGRTERFARTQAP